MPQESQPAHTWNLRPQAPPPAASPDDCHWIIRDCFMTLGLCSGVFDVLQRLARHNGSARVLQCCAPAAPCPPHGAGQLDQPAPSDRPDRGAAVAVATAVRRRVVALPGGLAAALRWLARFVCTAGTSPPMAWRSCWLHQLCWSSVQRPLMIAPCSDDHRGRSAVLTLASPETCA